MFGAAVQLGRNLRGAVQFGRTLIGCQGCGRVPERCECAARAEYSEAAYRAQVEYHAAIGEAQVRYAERLRAIHERPSFATVQAWAPVPDATPPLPPAPPRR